MGAKCKVCGHALTATMSVAKGIGPVCWAKCGGQTFEPVLEAKDEEWERRENVLRAGGEMDFGVNWRHIISEKHLPQTMRVSVRFREGMFEAYGVVFGGFGHAADQTLIFTLSPDIKVAFAAAVEAGPLSAATVDAHLGRRRR